MLKWISYFCSDSSQTKERADIILLTGERGIGVNAATLEFVLQSPQSWTALTPHNMSWLWITGSETNGYRGSDKKRE